MFEPVHGSAPDIAGQSIANPVGRRWVGAMRLEHLGHKAATVDLIRAIESVLAAGIRTADLDRTGQHRAYDVRDRRSRFERLISLR